MSHRPNLSRNVPLEVSASYDRILNRPVSCMDLITSPTRRFMGAFPFPPSLCVPAPVIMRNVCVPLLTQRGNIVSSSNVTASSACCPCKSTVSWPLQGVVVAVILVLLRSETLEWLDFVFRQRNRMCDATKLASSAFCTYTRGWHFTDNDGVHICMYACKLPVVSHVHVACKMLPCLLQPHVSYPL
jgi:hypothetical protein